jgi:RHS repeat-associated protein
LRTSVTYSYSPIKTSSVKTVFSNDLNRDSGFPKNYFKAYRYGFNGQERDDEVSGAGNSYTAEFWQYDPRIGRRWNIDPVNYPWQSSYSCFNSNPILYQDPNGLYGTKREAKRQKESADKQGYVTGEIKSNKTGNLIFNRYDYSFQGYDPNQSEATVTDYSSTDFRTSAEREFDWQMELAFDNVVRAMKENSSGSFMQYGPFGKNTGGTIENFTNSMKGTTYRSDWEGSSDMDNSGDVTPEEGLKLALGTISVIASGGIITFVGGNTFAYVSLGSNIDDLTTQSDGSTLLSNVTGIDSKYLNGAKLLLNLVGFKKNITSLIDYQNKTKSVDVITLFYSTEILLGGNQIATGTYGFYDDFIKK